MLTAGFDSTGLPICRISRSPGNPSPPESPPNTSPNPHFGQGDSPIGFCSPRKRRAGGKHWLWDGVAVQREAAHQQENVKTWLRSLIFICWHHSKSCLYQTFPPRIRKKSKAAERCQKQAGVQITFGAVKVISFCITHHADRRYTRTRWKNKQNHFTAMQAEIFSWQKGLRSNG